PRRAAHSPARTGWPAVAALRCPAGPASAPRAARAIWRASIPGARPPPHISSSGAPDVCRVDERDTIRHGCAVPRAECVEAVHGADTPAVFGPILRLIEAKPVEFVHVAENAVPDPGDRRPIVARIPSGPTT